MCLGAAEAASSSGLDIASIGFDALPEALLATQAGTFAATVGQWASRQITGALDMLVTFVRTGTQPAERTVLIEPTLITASNLGQAERAAEAGITPTGTPAAAIGETILRTEPGGLIRPLEPCTCQLVQKCVRSSAAVDRGVPS